MPLSGTQDAPGARGSNGSHGSHGSQGARSSQGGAHEDTYGALEAPDRQRPPTGPLARADRRQPSSAGTARTPERRGAALAVWVGVAIAASAGLAGLLATWLHPAAAAATGVLTVGLAGLLWLEFGPRARGGMPAADTQQRALAPDARVAGVSRAVFTDMAEREFARARRYGTGAALLLIDIDRWARLSEAHGSAAGERVLGSLLRLTAPTLRTADVITRYTSTQVAVFLAHADATGALDVAERVRERAEQLEVLLADSPAASTARVRFTLSVGVAHLRPAHLNLKAMADDAEDAVLAARQAGGNCVRAAPVDATALRRAGGGAWRGNERRARPSRGPL